MNASDISTDLQRQVADAAGAKTPLQIQGGRTKQFLGRTATGKILDVSIHQGIVNYEPSELVITARSGTLLKSIEQTLSGNHQMLAFEPPHFGEAATLGGTIACNLSGPRRPYTGAARDYVLGTRIINGKGEIMRFGGEVMKNVAGYDVSRLMTGAMGTLGVLLEVSLKVLPTPEYECTVMHQLDAQQALDMMHALASRPLPITASCYVGETLYIRLSGTFKVVDAARKVIGGEWSEEAGQVWQEIREQTHGFFKWNKPLWRLSVASDVPPLNLVGHWCYEWGGALRWLVTDVTADTIRQCAANVGGHATLYRKKDVNPDQVFQPLAPGLWKIHQQLKSAMDPCAIFNPGRLYQGL